MPALRHFIGLASARIAISDFALAISVQQVAWGLGQPFAGILADKHGTRWVSLAGQRPGAHADRPLQLRQSWLFGWLGDTYPKRLLPSGIYLLRALALVLLFAFTPTPLSVVLFGAAIGILWLGVIPLVKGLVVQIFGLRLLSTLTGIAFLSRQAGSYHLAWKLAVVIGLIAGTMQLLMNDRPTARMQALPAVAA